MLEEITIRSIQHKDLEEVFSMLLELVEHENMMDRFTMTREVLEKDLFEAYADWQGLVAVDEKDRPVGLLLYSIANLFRAYNQGAMIQIDELYVRPVFRKQGIGEALLMKLAAIATQKNIQRIYVWCIKENEQGKKFYEKMGAANL